MSHDGGKTGTGQSFVLKAGGACLRGGGGGGSERDEPRNMYGCFSDKDALRRLAWRLGVDGKRSWRFVFCFVSVWRCAFAWTSALNCGHHYFHLVLTFTTRLSRRCPVAQNDTFSPVFVAWTFCNIVYLLTCYINYITNTAWFRNSDGITLKHYVTLIYSV